jgi:microcystin degradation protein MlrC
VHTVSGGLSRGSSQAGGSQLWVSVKFGDNNVVVISPFLSQIVDPKSFTQLGIDPGQFKGFAIKSRVHFRRGFYDSGFAKTILLVEPDDPFVGTVRLEALNYKFLKLDKFYPYGKNVTYP